MRTGAPGQFPNLLKTGLLVPTLPSMESVLPVFQFWHEVLAAPACFLQGPGPPAGSTSLPLLATDLRGYLLTQLTLT